MVQRGERAAHRILLVSLWVAATVIAGVVTWTAVARLGHEAMASTQPMLSQAEVRRELGRSHDPTAPTPGAPSSSAPTNPRSAPPRRSTSPPQLVPRRSRSWTVAGGHVIASCRGNAIRIDYASPVDGWGMQIDNSGPTDVSVEFSRGDSDVTVAATCAGGIPSLSSTANDD